MGLLLPGPSGGAPVQSPQVPAPAPAQAADAAAPAFDVAWQAEAGTNGPAQMIAGASMLFVADGASLRAFNTTDGTSAWTADAAIAGPMAAGQDVLVAYADESLRVFDQKTGAERWSTPVEPPAAGATVTANGMVAATGSVLRAWTVDGQPRWQRDVGATAATAIVAAGDVFIAALSDKTLLAVNASDGTPRWRHEVPSLPRHLTVDGDRIYFGAADGAVYAYDVRGSRDFSWRFAVRAEMIGTPAVDERCLYTALIDNTVRALKRDIGNLCWLTPLHMRPAGGPVIAGDAVGVVTATGTLVALDRKTGRSLGTPVTAPGAPPETRPRLLASTTSADGTIFTLTLSSASPPTITAFKRGR